VKILTSVTTALLLSVAFLAGTGTGRCLAADAHGRQTVRDMAGRNVTVPAHITRVATNGGVIEEWILMMGGQSKLVATSVSNQHNPWFIKLFPQIRKIPAVFSASGDANTMTIPGVIMGNAGIRYQFMLDEHKTITTRFGATNLANSSYWTSTGSGGLNLLSPRLFAFSGEFNF